MFCLTFLYLLIYGNCLSVLLINACLNLESSNVCHSLLETSLPVSWHVLPIFSFHIRLMNDSRSATNEMRFLNPVYLCGHFKSWNLCLQLCVSLDIFSHWVVTFLQFPPQFTCWNRMWQKYHQIFFFLLRQKVNIWWSQCLVKPFSNGLFSRLYASFKFTWFFSLVDYDLFSFRGIGVYCLMVVCGLVGTTWRTNVWSLVVWSGWSVWVGNISTWSWLYVWTGHSVSVQPHQWAESDFESPPACHGRLQLVSGSCI